MQLRRTSGGGERVQQAHHGGVLLPQHCRMIHGPALCHRLRLRLLLTTLSAPSGQLHSELRHGQQRAHCTHPTPQVAHA